MAFFTTGDGCRLFYRVRAHQSPRPWVIFLNGTAQAALQWLPTGQHLSGGFSFLVYDGRGQGQSSPGSVPLTLDVHAADLTALMDHLGIGAAHLVGLSHGALVGLKLALDAPPRVQKLVLCGLGFPTAPFNRIVIRSWLEVLKTGGLQALCWSMLPDILGPVFLGTHHRAADDMVKAMVHRNRPRSLQAHLEAVLTYPPPSEWTAPPSCPCLVVNGGDDRLADADALAGRLGPALVETVILKDCGHSCPLEAPRRFGACIEDFLAST